jgi:hypothetical protein
MRLLGSAKQLVPCLGIFLRKKKCLRIREQISIKSATAKVRFAKGATPRASPSPIPAVPRRAAPIDIGQRGT